MTEIEWRPVPGYVGTYVVSSAGVVIRVGSNKPLTPEIIKDGYLRVYLSLLGVGRKFQIHRLVAGAFIGDGTGWEVNHKDGVKTNNSIGNLEYVTHAENCRHAQRTGLIGPNRGNRTPSRRIGHGKLSKSEVLEIRTTRIPFKHTAYSIPSLAKKFGVSRNCIRSVVSRITYAYID
jgi:hypothetical protein